MMGWAIFFSVDPGGLGSILFSIRFKGMGTDVFRYHLSNEKKGP